MKKLLFLLLFTISSSFAQNQALAVDYLENRDYEKAVAIFEELYAQNQNNQVVFLGLIACYSELKQFDIAEKIILQKEKTNNSPYLIVERAYLWELQNQKPKAEALYQEAVNAISVNANMSYAVARAFETKGLIDWVIKSYEKGKEVNPELNIDYQIALLEGQRGNTGVMADKLLDYAFNNQGQTARVQNNLTFFMSNESNSTFSDYLRKSLLIRTQKTPNTYWNQFLSWFFVQNEQYDKAFTQEKAVYKREGESLQPILTLATLAIEANNSETVDATLNFILENTTDTDLKIKAHYFLMQQKIDNAAEIQYNEIEQELDLLLKQYGIRPTSIMLQILTARFYCFKQNNPVKAIKLLEESLKLPMTSLEKGSLKMELAECKLFAEQFDQSILLYAQVETNAKHDELAHEATFKMAKANYFKNDFEWALTQVKVLKQSPSLLIANDAIELYLTINDNTAEDSTQMALKAFSKAEFALFQNKTQDALQQFLTLLEKHKGEEIEDETLFKIAKIYESQKNYTEALNYYETILAMPESIYRDEAYYFSAEIYRIHLVQPEKAKVLYEKIVLEHQDSIYFGSAQKQYRQLRGDNI